MLAGYDSGVSSTAASFTRSSTEEEAGGRPLSWHQGDPGLAEQRPQQLYDADDELAGAARRQRRPTSLCGVSSLYSRDTWHPASPPGPAYQRRYEKGRSGRSGTSRRRAARYSCGDPRPRYISQSCAPRPYHYQAREPHPLSRRAREEDSAEADNLSNEVSLRLRDSKDQMVERVMQVDTVTTVSAHLKYKYLTFCSGTSEYIREAKAAQGPVPATGESSVQQRGYQTRHFQSEI